MADAKIVISAEDRATGTLKSVSDQFDKFGSVAGMAIAPLRALQGALAAVSAVSTLAGIKAITGALDDLDEAAQGVGLTARSLAELRQAAVFAGVDAGKLDKSLGSLANRLSDASRGGKESAAIFQALGISIKDQEGNLRATDEVLGDLADRFSQYRDSTEKTALANALFGDKLGRVLIPYLNQGRDALKQYAGVTDESVREAVRLQSEFDKLAASSTRFGNEVAAKVIPAINLLIERLPKISFREAFQNIGNEGVAGFIKNIETQSRVLQNRADQRQQGLALLGGQSVFDPRDAAALGRRNAPGLPDLGGSKAKEGLTDAQRALAQYVEGLQRAIERTLDLSESEKTAAAIRSGAFGEITPQVRQLLMQLAEQADATKALRQIEEQAARDQKKEYDEREKQAKAITDWQIRLAQETSKRYTQQSEFLRTETEQVNAARTEQLQIAIDAREADLISEDEYQARRAEIMERYAQMAGDIEARRYGQNKAYRELDLQSAGAFFNQMSGLMNSKSRKLFEIGKAAAIGETIVNTYSAAMGAYKSLASIPIVGPALGAAAAAAAVASGIAQVQRIKSTAFGGGGGSVSSANVATPGQGPFSTNVATPASAAPRGPAIQITLSGSGRYSAQEVRDLITQINEQAGLGATVAVAA